MSRKNKGFTLIELMVVLVIIAILVAISVPIYQDYVFRSRRAQCQSEMLNAASRIERQYSVTSTYTNVGGLTQCPSGGTAFYNVVYGAPGGNQTFTLTATPVGAQAGDRCGVMTLNQAGARTPATGNCWR